MGQGYQLHNLMVTECGGERGGVPDKLGYWHQGTPE